MNSLLLLLVISPCKAQWYLDFQPIQPLKADAPCCRECEHFRFKTPVIWNSASYSPFCPEGVLAFHVVVRTAVTFLNSINWFFLVMLTEPSYGENLTFWRPLIPTGIGSNAKNSDTSAFYTVYEVHGGKQPYRTLWTSTLQSGRCVEVPHSGARECLLPQDITQRDVTTQKTIALLTSETRNTAVGETLLFPRVRLSCRCRDPDRVVSVRTGISVETALWLQSERISMSQFWLMLGARLHGEQARSVPGLL